MGNVKTGYRLRPVEVVTASGYACVPGYPSATKGLSITQEFSFRGNTPHEQLDARSGRGGAWAVTHTNSGRRLAPASWRFTRAEALALAERLGEFSTDWDQCKDSRALAAWGPALVEYFNNFADEHGLPHVGSPNPPRKHERTAEEVAEDAAVIEAELAVENDVERDEAQQAEVAKELPDHVPTVERHVEDAPAFTGEEDDDGSGRPAAPPGWEWKEPGFDSYLICPCGDEIEQDGKCPAGHVSFLRQWGFI